jgi:exodeoxyribonuclease VII small subunit
MSLRLKKHWRISLRLKPAPPKRLADQPPPQGTAGPPQEDPAEIGMKMAKKDLEKKKFEEALEDLEKIVERLESGELSLEESLAAFEDGVRLVKFCNRKLTEVEKKIELLVKDKNGTLQLKPLEDEEEEPEGES